MLPEKYCEYYNSAMDSKFPIDIWRKFVYTTRALEVKHAPRVVMMDVHVVGKGALYLSQRGSSW